MAAGGHGLVLPNCELKILSNNRNKINTREFTFTFKPIKLLATLISGHLRMVSYMSLSYWLGLLLMVSCVITIPLPDQQEFPNSVSLFF